MISCKIKEWDPIKYVRITKLDIPFKNKEN